MDDKNQPVKRDAFPQSVPVPSGLEGLDISSLSEEQRQELVMLAAKDRLGLLKRYRELEVDAAALHANLGTYTTSASDGDEQGIAVTITNTRDDQLGRTEIMVGNTDVARSGKLSRSQKGAPDTTYMWMAFAVVVLIIVAIAAVQMTRG